jgi:hypothetical protein
VTPEDERDELWDSLSERDRLMWLAYVGLLIPFPLGEEPEEETKRATEDPVR